MNNDPFWSAVRRRHPDLDIVILPPEPEPVADSTLPVRAPEPFAALEIAEADGCWQRLVGHGMPTSVRRWIPGPTRDSVRHAVTLTLDGVSAAAGLGHLREASAPLKADGWQVFIPPTGMPRIAADRAGEMGAESLLFGYATETGRLFLRLTSTGLPVSAGRARELIGSVS
ncbi:hypothetical protein [Microbacterium sp.]|uniref:hypothetical protein n=1 Tax=Microbacterium sp. TaxID=51671 RepID=UPI0039E29986